MHRKWWLQNSRNQGFRQLLLDFRFLLLPVSQSAKVGAGLRLMKYSSKPEIGFDTLGLCWAVLVAQVVEDWATVL